MVSNNIITTIRDVGRKILSANSKLVLFGSRARGDATKESDWDILILIDKPRIENSDFDKYAYPLIQTGWTLGHYFSIKLYTHTQWEERRLTAFYKNVESEGIALA